MKAFVVTLFVFIVSINYGQSVTGKIVDENGEILSNYTVKIYYGFDSLTTKSDSEGKFLFNLTNVEDEQLPTNYSISNNYPNPFNPRTRIDFSLPAVSKVKIEIYNSLGQRVKDIIEMECSTGNSHVDLELNGLPNGVYFARINVDGKYNVVKKMMLLYGSQHLAVESANLTTFAKSLNLFHIDKIVVNGDKFREKTFTGFEDFTTNSIDVGSLEMQISCPGEPTVEYEGKTYRTVLIGNKCWLRENLNVGTMVTVNNMQNNGIVEKLCYNNVADSCVKYGGLYSWNEACKGVTEVNGTQGICPEGWHLPTATDIAELKTLATNNSVGMRAKGYSRGTNTSGFEGILSGYSRVNFAAFNSNSTFLGYPEKYFDIPVYDANVYLNNAAFMYHSVRCVKGALPKKVTLISPELNSIFIPNNPTKFKWRSAKYATSYRLQLSHNPDFSVILIDVENIVDTSYEVHLGYGQDYFYRIISKSELGYAQEYPMGNFKTRTAVNYGVPCPGQDTIVYNGKIYHTVVVGNYCYLKENLNIGDMIASTKPQTDNQLVEKYCYNDDPNNCEQYGGLYTFREAMQYSDVSKQGLCPPGWTLPDYDTFYDYQYTFGTNPDYYLESGENGTGFSAILGGYFNNVFSGLNSKAFFWSNYYYNVGGNPNMPVWAGLQIDDQVNIKWRSISNDAGSIRCYRPLN